MTASVPPRLVHWYPEGTDQLLTLTWVLAPSTSDSDGGPDRNLELMAEIGGAGHKLALGSHMGYLVPSEQSLCNPSVKNESVVSLLQLNTMGPETITLVRSQPTALDVIFHVEADDDPAKLDGKLGTLEIPADARITEAIWEKTDSGKARTFDCEAKAYEPSVSGLPTP